MLTPSMTCAICHQPMESERTARVCSPRCRTALWRRDRARAHAATVRQLQIENQTLRHRIAELEHLVGQVKQRLWARR
jgi:predicted nucleic acid-binding Zn ribbon protein